MKNKKLVLFGSGEIAEIAEFYLTNDSQYSLDHFCLDGEFIKEDSFLGRPVLPFEEIEKSCPPDQYAMMVVMGYSKHNKIREEKYVAAKEKSYNLATYISSKASYYNTPVGENCFIFEDNTIQPHTKIGNNVIMWSGNHLGHHSSVGDNCFISSHVVVSGGVNIGRNCFIGVNTSIRDHIDIGDYTLVGMGANVQNSSEPYTVFKTEKTEGFIRN